MVPRCRTGSGRSQKPVQGPRGSPWRGGVTPSSPSSRKIFFFFSFTTAEGRSCPAWSQRRGGRRGDSQGDRGRGLKAPTGEQQGEVGGLNKARGVGKEACSLAAAGRGPRGSLGWARGGEAAPSPRGAQGTRLPPPGHSPWVTLEEADPLQASNRRHLWLSEAEPQEPGCSQESGGTLTPTTAPAGVSQPCH